ncbi:nuclear transport factor 2 family protein [Actinomadura chibensis]|uniref:Nuclear transport factor 2 family protein n=1 Tax=Actinomadura chibensis TaxID=392828 RepID=A0A5D0NA61_9ACTN|nr:nuclear transport factor 2 family protein [Actinomadura chibensis]TYB41313.1 nuclear transport factor 2 family protein [Actinomadura chibensis]
MYVTRERALDPGAGAAALRDHAEIVDALYRFGLGQDLKDPALFASCFAADAELDFRPAAAAWGAAPPVMTGRDAIVAAILGGFEGRVDTTHQVTNPRVVIDSDGDLDGGPGGGGPAGDTARLTALVEAQHLLTADRSVHALLKNLYDTELVRDGRRWVLRRVVIDNVWYTGDPAAVFT